MALIEVDIIRLNALKEEMARRALRIEAIKEEFQNIVKNIDGDIKAGGNINSGIRQIQGELDKEAGCIKNHESFLELSSREYLKAEGQILKTSQDTLKNTAQIEKDGLGIKENGFNLWKGIGGVLDGVDDNVTNVGYAFKMALAALYKTVGELNIVRNGKYTYIKGIMNKGLGTKFLTKNLFNGKYPLKGFMINGIDYVGKASKVVSTIKGMWSGYNELFVLNKDKSGANKVGRAVWSISSDVIAPIGVAAGGGKLGAIIGGAIGTMFFPGVGTAVGAAIGGAIGAIGATSTLERVKEWKPDGENTVDETAKHMIGVAADATADWFGGLWKKGEEFVGNAFNGNATSASH